MALELCDLGLALDVVATLDTLADEHAPADDGLGWLDLVAVAAATCYE